ncbi:adenylate/guanylate cyclase domain-containing protein [Simplicispira lacusdiani]|uniref:adenylate/guanylate cyclase domain-containing protein n=1 Tax=Simplicispira lacusdiani TaxID=2213010 RepID=UPI0018E581D0|nr:adenylate/guanylate cyclase domain-containing protein [Simplicispira lacusdiani]
MTHTQSLADAWRPWALRVLGGLLLLAALWLMPPWVPLQRLEYDLVASLVAPPRPEAGVLVVGIDEPSLAELGQAPPLPRRLHARLIEALTDAGAAALGVDLLLGAAQSPEDDAALARALQGPLPVVLASADVVVRGPQVAHYQQRVESVFTQARHGTVAMPVDDDGVVRQAPAQDDALWRVLAQAAGRAVTPPPPGALLRHYAPEVALPYAHYTQALDAARSLPPEALRGRLVLLGQNTPVGGEDQFATPLRVLGEASRSGVLLHATALHNGLAGDWVVPAHPLGPWLQAGLAVGLAAWFTRRWNGWRASSLSLLLGGGAVLGSLAAYVAGLWWPALPTLAGLAAHLNVGAAGSYWRERRRRERLRRDFARYVPEDVVNELARTEAGPLVQGERRVLTLLFADLAGFTAASERLPPEAVAQALNAFFTRMTECVHRHGGTLDKFIGDAVMAFWNAPLPAPDHARRALACALDMQAAMAALRAGWQGTPFAPVQLRIGLHTGEAAVGHLGSQARFTYTAVGDAVNTAARLEGANKALGTQILLSGATREALGTGGGPLLWLDSVRLAGRSGGIDVYTPCDDAELARIAEALRGHALAGRQAQALEHCAAWRARAAQVAPRWLAHGARLEERLHDGAPLRPRALDKS